MKSIEENLKKSFNGFWNEILETDSECVDYFSKMDISKFVRMKRALCNIHNILTLETTLAFVDFLDREGVIRNPTCVKENILGKSANANGFDVDCDDGRGHRIVAEVKCNAPIRENTFSTSQVNAIKKDLEGLRHGKKSSAISGTAVYRFLVFLDIRNVRSAVANLKLDENFLPLVEYQSSCSLCNDTIYVVYVAPDSVGPLHRSAESQTLSRR